MRVLNFRNDKNQIKILFPFALALFLSLLFTPWLVFSPTTKTGRKAQLFQLIQPIIYPAMPFASPNLFFLVMAFTFIKNKVMIKPLTFFVAAFLCTLSVIHSQNVGIGTTSPTARLHVSEGSTLFSATGVASIVPGNPPASGMGRRTMWYADKAAFRSGFVSNNAWDKDSIGYYSFAAGYDAKATDVGAVALSHYAIARGLYSFALGYNCKALKPNAIAMGLSSIANGDGSFAVGEEALASGVHALALGSYTEATAAGSVALGSGAESSGVSSAALGSGSKATGFYSTALGYASNSTGTQSIAIGAVTASGSGSIAIGGGFASTNEKTGACVIADNYNQATLLSTANYQMSMRFSGGYKLFSWYDLSTGVQLSPGGGAWTVTSDRKSKENLRTINKEDLLQKVASLPITNWNYKTQPVTQRHIGPMAQDFYAAFQLDGIGADTTINTMDISGVNMVAIQALEERTTALRNENDMLKAKNEKTEAALIDLKARLQKMEEIVNRKN